MRYKRDVLRQKEQNRYSVITFDLKRCIECRKAPVDINEIFPGRNRLNSIKYSLCIPLCRDCHIKYHNNREMQLKWQKKGLEIFLEDHSIDEFKETFRYIKGLDLF